MNKTIRVGVSNNFNFTKDEYQELALYGSNRNMFVNSNIFPINSNNVDFINSKQYKIVFTINPYLDVSETAIAKLLLLDMNLVSFVRLKYIPDYDLESIHKKLSALGYNVVITNMRFKRKETFHKYIKQENRHKYTWSRNYYRLNKEYLPNFEYVCDRSGTGCQDCMLCVKLTFDNESNIYSVNLKSSGYCKYNCPDCFAKFNSIRAGNKIAFSKVFQNTKQKVK